MRVDRVCPSPRQERCTQSSTKSSAEVSLTPRRSPALRRRTASARTVHRRSTHVLLITRGRLTLGHELCHPAVEAPAAAVVVETCRGSGRRAGPTSRVSPLSTNTKSLIARRLVRSSQSVTSVFTTRWRCGATRHPPGVDLRGARRAPMCSPMPGNSQPPSAQNVATMSSVRPSSSAWRVRRDRGADALARPRRTSRSRPSEAQVLDRLARRGTRSRPPARSSSCS